MPVHDWTRVTAGTFHHFHNAWIVALSNALNGGVLPEGYYALGEQRTGEVSPDVLALHEAMSPAPQVSAMGGDERGMIAVAEHPPQVTATLQATTDAGLYLPTRRTLVIYHTTADRIVALIEILSPATKHSQLTLADFLAKVGAALRAGYHVLVVDLWPPGRYDPSGIHGVIWDYITGQPWPVQTELPLTLASYCASLPITAYIEPTRVASRLPDMPLFLTPEHYIYVPLEQTYMLAWQSVPQRWRRVIEPS